MGGSILARCSCGYESRVLRTGFGINFRHFDYAIALCRGCSDVVMLNKCNKPLCCIFCGSQDVVDYTSLEKSGRYGNKLPDELMDDFKFTDARYLCPKCDRHEMQMLFGGSNWD